MADNTGEEKLQHAHKSAGCFSRIGRFLSVMLFILGVSAIIVGAEFRNEALYAWCVVAAIQSGANLVKHFVCRIVVDTNRNDVHGEQDAKKLDNCMFCVNVVLYLVLIVWGAIIFADIVRRDENLLTGSLGGEFLWAFFNLRFWILVACLLLVITCAPVVFCCAIAFTFTAEGLVAFWNSF